MGISADGFVSTAEGVPAHAIMPGFVPGVSHGFPEFIEGCDAVVMGRNTFVPALGGGDWPWPDLQVFVLTSQPLPASAPGGVIAVAGPAAMAERLRARGSDADVHLVGGPRTIRAFHEIGALDRLELVVVPVLLGDGLRLWSRQAKPVPLRLLRADRSFPDGSVELVYAPGEPDPAQ